MKSQAVKESLPLDTQQNTQENTIHFKTYGGEAGPTIIWTHGWAQSHSCFKKLINTLEKMGKHIAIDFPGFGESPEPNDVWGTADYADSLANLIKTQTSGKVIWVGHSFGCRVGLQIATRHPDLIDGMFFIAGAGLKRKRSPIKALYLKLRVLTYKLLKACIPIGVNEEWLIKTFAATDFKNASGIIRQIFVKVVNEDLSDIAKNVTCPVHLVYGENDTETPTEIGQRLNKLIPSSELTILQGQDHYSVLGDGRHQVAPLLKNFIESLKQTS